MRLKIPKKIAKTIKEKIQNHEIAKIKDGKCTNCRKTIENRFARFCKNCGFLFIDKQITTT